MIEVFKAKTCDRCLKKFDESRKLDEADVPARGPSIRIEINGKLVLFYEDLCPACFKTCNRLTKEIKLTLKNNASKRKVAPKRKTSRTKQATQPNIPDAKDLKVVSIKAPAKPAVAATVKSAKRVVEEKLKGADKTTAVETSATQVSKPQLPSFPSEPVRTRWASSLTNQRTR